MADEFKLSTEAEDVEFKAYSRHFETRNEKGDDHTRAVVYVVGTMAFPDSGWTVRLVPVADRPDEWFLLEDAPGYGDHQRTYVIASGTTDHQVEEVPKSILVRYGKNGDESTRVSVVAWD